MTRRICPICDHVMKSRHYCRFCKAFVAHPNVINATYYLNESSPESRLRGTAPSPSDRTKNRPAETDTSAAVRRRSGAVAAPSGKYSAPPASTGKRYSAPGKAGSSGNTAQGAIVIIIAAIFLCMVMMGLLPFFMFLF